MSKTHECDCDKSSCGCDNKNKTADVAAVEDILARYKGYKGALMPILQEVQTIYGYLPAAALESVAEQTKTPMSRVYGVATFYSQFRLTPVGRNLVRVCHGTACHVAGAENITLAVEKELGLKNGETTADSEFTLESVACLGCCSLAPVAMVNGETHGRLTPDKVKKVVKRYERLDH